MASSKKKVFVTVGTTQFDQLIRVCTDPGFLHELTSNGFNTLQLQIGNSAFTSPHKNGENITITHFNYKEDIGDEILEADLVISHAGAGTCMEVLRCKKPLIVVINDTLMNNHQIELANKLSNNHYAIACTPDTLISCIKKLDYKYFMPLPPVEPNILSSFLDQIMD